MADISITGSNVVKTATTKLIETLPAAATIAAGDALYKLANGTYGLAQCDVALANIQANFVGLALNPAAAGQPVTPGTGLITIAASGLVAGQQLNLSATAGKIAPVADLANTNNVVTAGIVMSATTVFIAPKVWGVLATIVVEDP